MAGSGHDVLRIHGANRPLAIACQLGTAIVLVT